MTNEQIILNAKAELVKDGKIKAEDELHTYKYWKKLGYQVFRGEKAVIALNIWQCAGGEKDDDPEQEEEKKRTGRMYMRRTSFFSSSQVFALDN